VSAAALPWVVVTNPGTDSERVDGEFEHRATAKAHLHDLQAAGDDADLMKRRADGTLTTEF
jgi:hypothetical protein